MKRKVKNLLIVMVTLILLLPVNISAKDDVKEITLSSNKDASGNYSFSAKVDGEDVTEYDYAWHLDPATEHKDVKNSPAEYYTGTKPTGEESVYIAHDIYYYPELDADKFKQVRYGDENEWAYYYEIEGYEDYIFATLPIEGNSVNKDRMHTEEEAYNNAVLHITEAGTYRLSGDWHGQVFVDLGEDSFDDESAVVTLILNNIDIECTVASGICFYQVYECDNEWEDRENAYTTIDTSAAGANIILADDSENTVSGTNIYRILKTKYKDEEDTAEIKEQKKRLKIDGTVYSFMSMNIDGETKGNGVLNINAGFEGLDTELHLTINGGYINIVSDNDGVNVNEDNVSIFTMNDGTLQILAGTGSEGDGIDSNGYLNINGGTVISSAKPQSDSGLDSDCGTYINGGSVVAFGSSMDVVDEYNEDAENVTMNLVFANQQDITTPLVFTSTAGKGVVGFDLSNNEMFKSANRTYQCLIVSSEGFSVGETYNVYTASYIKGVENDGFYTSVSSFNKADQLGYSLTGNSGFGPNGGNFDPNSNNPNQGNFDFGNKNEFDPNSNNSNPGNFNGQMPSDMQNQQGGQGFPNQGMPTSPDANQQGNGQKQEGQNTNVSAIKNVAEAGQVSDLSTGFKAEDKVNTFSGVRALTSTTTNDSSIVMPVWTFAAILGSVLLLGALAGFVVTKLVVEKKNVDKTVKGIREDDAEEIK